MSDQRSDVIVADIDRDQFWALTQKANDGDPAALAKLRATLAANPGIGDKLGDLAGMVEEALCASIAPGNITTKELVSSKLSTLRQSLLERSRCEITRLAVDRVVLGWLMVNLMDLRYPDVTKLPPAEANVVIKQKVAAERRYQSALRTLATIRQLIRPAVTDKNSKTAKRKRSAMHLNVVADN